MSDPKYFFIAYEGMILKDLPDGAELPEIFSDKKYAGKMPINLTGTDIITSDKGMFLPSAIESFIKATRNLSECKIVFVREMTKEEVDAEKSFVETLDKPLPISNTVMSEIDDLINATERGNLRIVVDPSSEKSHEEDEDLPGLGGLFDEPEGWKD